VGAVSAATPSLTLGLGGQRGCPVSFSQTFKINQLKKTINQSINQSNQSVNQTKFKIIILLYGVVNFLTNILESCSG
jgi:hypothetical protein